MSNYNQSLSLNGLGTYSLVVKDAGSYVVKGKISLPTIPSGSAQSSSLVVTINKNGSAQYTGPTGARGFYVNIPCIASDTLAIVFSSAAAIDQQLNSIQTVLTIDQE